MYGHKPIYINKSGYHDPTAGEALGHIEYEWDRAYLAQQALHEFRETLGKIGVRTNYIKLWDKFSGKRIGKKRTRETRQFRRNSGGG